MTDYKVQLENFYGPFDLLLYLVKEEELNIYDIPIARITQQYLSYLEMIKQLDINVGSEFLVVAATLMEIKSRTLLPPPEEAEEEADPRFELVRKLIEYKKYKDLSQSLGKLVEQQSRTYHRPFIEIETPAGGEAQPLVELNLWALVKTFAKITRETALEVPQLDIIYDDVPIEQFIKNIMERLATRRQMTFTELNTGQTNRLNMLKNFLALLELAKEKRVELLQENDFGEITMHLVEVTEPTAELPVPPATGPNEAQPAGPLNAPENPS